MSLWARIQYLGQEAKQRIYDIYEQHELSYEVRDHLAVWIENNIINELNNGSGTGGDENMRMAMICSELISEIRRVADTIGNNNLDFSHFRLHSKAQFFQTLPPSDLYARFKACLTEEMKVLNEQTDSETPGESVSKNQYEDEVKRLNTRQSAIFSQRVCTLTNSRKEWASLVEEMQSILNELQIHKERKNAIDQFVANHHQQQLSLNGFVNFESNAQRELQKVDQEIEHRKKRIEQLELATVKLAEMMVTELVVLVPTLINDYISKLKWSEMTPEEYGLSSLDDVQRWYNELLEIIAQLRGLWTSYLLHTPPALLQQLLKRLEPVLYSLISNSLVVQDQPSQVIKKDTKFNTSVRFLSGERFISPQHSPVVKVSVVNEKYAALLFQKKSPNQVSYVGHGKIINSVGTRFTESDNQRWTQKVVMQFRNVAISNVLRGEKAEKSQKGAYRAMTEKFCLLFTSTLDILGTSYEIWCCSVPFVFIVHVSQKCEGWGNIFWDNSFREMGRTPFKIPQEVTWNKMAVALRKCFKSMTGTNWNLTESNLRYIGGKIFKTTEFNDNCTITRRQFCEKEATNKIGLWEWFYSIIELTNKHLQPFWEKGFIVGFMDRCHAERDILARMSPGTFILRFSDSSLGGISISYAVQGNDGRLDIRSLAPFTDNDLKVRSLADRIHDAEQFVNVYYHGCDNLERLTAKAQAFPRPNDKNPFFPGKLVRSSYVQAEVVMVIASSSSTLTNNTTNTMQALPLAQSPLAQSPLAQSPLAQSPLAHSPLAQQPQPDFNQIQPRRLSGDSCSSSLPPQSPVSLPAQSPVNPLDTMYQQIEMVDEIMEDEDGWVDFLDEVTNGILDPQVLQEIYDGFENLSMPPVSPANSIEHEYCQL